MSSREQRPHITPASFDEAHNMTSVTELAARLLRSVLRVRHASNGYVGSFDVTIYEGQIAGNNYSYQKRDGEMAPDSLPENVLYGKMMLDVMTHYGVSVEPVLDPVSERTVRLNGKHVWRATVFYGGNDDKEGTEQAKWLHGYDVDPSRAVARAMIQKVWYAQGN